MTQQQKFEKYRQTILDKYNFDINNFKYTNKYIILNYRIDQLIIGIGVEKQHTDNISTALQITIDHLEQIPDYYDRLVEMQKGYKESYKIKQNKNTSLFSSIIQQIVEHETNQCNTG